MHSFSFTFDLKGRFDERDTYNCCANLLRNFVVGYPRRTNVHDIKYAMDYLLINELDNLVIFSTSLIFENLAIS